MKKGNYTKMSNIKNYYKIKTTSRGKTYRYLCANFMHEKNYIGKRKYPFALGSIDWKGKHRWLYFESESDAQAFIDKYYKKLMSGANSKYIASPGIVKSFDSVQLKRIDNNGDIPVYCSIDYYDTRNVSARAPAANRECSTINKIRLVEIIKNLLAWASEHSEEWMEAFISAAGFTEQEMQEFNLDEYMNNYDEIDLE